MFDHSYYLYGLNVSSDIHLLDQEMPAAGPPDISIQRAADELPADVKMTEAIPVLELAYSWN